MVQTNLSEIEDILGPAVCVKDTATKRGAKSKTQSAVTSVRPAAPDQPSDLGASPALLKQLLYNLPRWHQHNLETCSCDVCKYRRLVPDVHLKVGIISQDQE